MAEDHVVTGDATLRIRVKWNARVEKPETETGDWIAEGEYKCTCGETFGSRVEAADHVWEQNQ